MHEKGKKESSFSLFRVFGLFLSVRSSEDIFGFFVIFESFSVKKASGE